MSRISTQFSSDDEYLLMIQEDNSVAFKKIYKKYWSKLYQSAYKLLRNREAAEDIVQEIMVQLWMKRRTIEIQSLDSYLYQAVRFQVFKSIRSVKGHVHHYSSHEIESRFVNNEAENNLIVIDINKNLDSGIAKLPEKCRQVFILSRKMQLSTKEIATLLGKNPKTVENQLTIAIHRLRSKICGE